MKTAWASVILWLSVLMFQNINSILTDYSCYFRLQVFFFSSFSERSFILFLGVPVLALGRGELWAGGGVNSTRSESAEKWGIMGWVGLLNGMLHTMKAARITQMFRGLPFWSKCYDRVFSGNVSEICSNKNSTYSKYFCLFFSNNI